MMRYLDGLNDNEEIIMNLNPNNVDKIVNCNYNALDGMVNVKIDNIDVRKYKSLKVKDSGNIRGIKNEDSYISGPYNFNISGNIDDAVISIKIDQAKLRDNSNPTIYYYNEKKDKFESLDTIVSDGMATARVKHFSNYVVLNKNYIDNKIINAPKIDGSNVSNESVSSVEYILSTSLIGNVFGKPIKIYIVDGDDKSIEKLKLEIDTLLNESGYDFEGIKINFEYGTVSKLEANIMDFMFSMFEDKTLDKLSSSSDKKNRNIMKSLLQIFYVYRHVYSGADLEMLLLGEVKGIITDDKILDKKKDSNHDGISDYYTKLICNGQLTTLYGENPFMGYHYSEIQNGGSDFDHDGLKNSEEVEISEKDGSYFLIMHTSPVRRDSDFDSVNDKFDKSPNLAFDSSFMSVSSMDYIPKTPNQDKFERKSDNVYNTVSGSDCGKFSCDNVIERAEMTAGIGKSMYAGVALYHFLDNKGEVLDFGSDWSLLETYSGKDNFVTNVERMLEIGESTVKKGDTLYFATDKELLGTDFSKDLEDVSDINWWYAVGTTNATMTAKIHNIDDKRYEMTLYYNIEDYYDWDIEQTMFNGGFGGLISDSEMYQLHLHGLARQYRIKIPYKMKITWNYGDRYYLSKHFTWENPESMIISKLN